MEELAKVERSGDTGNSALFATSQNTFCLNLIVIFYLLLFECSRENSRFLFTRLVYIF